MKKEVYIAHRTEDGRIQTVKAHLEGTAALSEGFASAFDAAEWGRWAGLAHDIGKYSQPFQRRITDPDHAPPHRPLHRWRTGGVAAGAGSGSLCCSGASRRSAGRRLPDGHSRCPHSGGPLQTSGAGLQRLAAGGHVASDFPSSLPGERWLYRQFLHPDALLLPGGCGFFGHRDFYAGREKRSFGSAA